MAELAVRCPLDECNLHNDLGRHPMGAKAWQSFGFSEWRFWDLELVEPRTKLQQQLRVEAGADFAGEDEIIPIEVSHEQCAETDAAALRIRESSNDEFLCGLALHLQPVRRAAVLVRWCAALCDHSFPSFPASTLPGVVVRNFWNVRQRRTEREVVKQCASSVERQAHHGTAVEPEDVEYVISDSASRIPRGLAVKDYVTYRKLGDCLGDGRVVLRQPVTRIKLHIAAILERKHADSIQLTLEDPLGPGETFLGQRCCHWHNPFWERCWFLV